MFYHVWFSTKRRKWLLMGDIDEAAKKAILGAARTHSIKLLECETMVDHVHLLIDAADDRALSSAIHLLKGASAREVLRSFPELGLDARTNHFWQKRFAAKSVDPGATGAVRQYIRTQKERADKYER